MKIHPILLLAAVLGLSEELHTMWDDFDEEEA